MQSYVAKPQRSAPAVVDRLLCVFSLEHLAVWREGGHRQVIPGVNNMSLVARLPMLLPACCTGYELPSTGSPGSDARHLRSSPCVWASDPVSMLRIHVAAQQATSTSADVHSRNCSKSGRRETVQEVDLPQQTAAVMAKMDDSSSNAQVVK